VIRMAVMVPLDLPQQLLLEHAAHAVLDQEGDHDWTIALVPFATISGSMLEVTCGRQGPWRVVLDATDPGNFQRALRGLVRSWFVREPSGTREAATP